MVPTRAAARLDKVHRHRQRLTHGGGAVHEWVAAVGLNSEDYGTHSLRRTRASILRKQTGNLRAAQILLGHTRIESTVRYLRVDAEDALEPSEAVDI